MIILSLKDKDNLKIKEKVICVLKVRRTLSSANFEPVVLLFFMTTKHRESGLE
jgi:hypothetical protein